MPIRWENPNGFPATNHTQTVGSNLKKNMEREFHFNKIYIFESLNDDEIKTGENLYNDKLRWKTFEIEGLNSDFKRINSRSVFFQELKIVKDQVKMMEILPILHFEMHGSDQNNGLLLSNGELITWQDLVTMFREINILSKNNLVVSLASCSGAYLNRAVRFNEKVPFWGFIGATQEISSKDIEISFDSFYETLLSTFDFNLSIKNLNEANNLPYRYAFYHAEEYFNFIFKKHEEESYGTENFKEWVSSLILKASNSEEITNHFSETEMLNRVTEILSDKVKIRNFFKNQFLNVNEL